MVRGIAPVLCTTRLVTVGGQKPTTCAYAEALGGKIPSSRTLRSPDTGRIRSAANGLVGPATKTAPGGGSIRLIDSENGNRSAGRAPDRLLVQFDSDDRDLGTRPPPKTKSISRYCDSLTVLSC